MSWLSISLPNPFKSFQFSDDDEQHHHQQLQDQDDAVSPGIGVKDDLSAIGETIGRQLRGVAAFLAPPPPAELAGDSSVSGEGSRTFDGIRSDLAEIGGSFKTSLSLLSSNNAVTGISKLASNFLQFNEVNNDDDKKHDDDDDEDEGVGITDEVVGFARQISNRPELWTDFPLSLNQEFDMSDAQSEHALVIEQLVPSLSDLRSRFSCDNHFWMIYFILLLPRLNDDDFELLSTPEIVEARETLLLMLRNNRDTEIDSEDPQLGGSSELRNEVDDTATENSNVSRSIEISESDNTKMLIKEDDVNECTSSDDPNQSDTKADNSSGNKEHENVDNCVVEENEDEDSVATKNTSNAASKRFQSDEDVSFSDLEDDDNDLPSRQSGSRPPQSTRGSSPEGSNEWVQLNRNVGKKSNKLRGQSSPREKLSEGEESSDWLTVDDFDP